MVLLKLLHIYRVNTFYLFCFLTSFLVFFESSVAQSLRRTWVAGPVKKQTLILLEQGKDLHEASFTSDLPLTLETIDKMQKQIKKIERLLMDGSKPSAHFKTLIKSVEGSLIKAKTLQKQQQRDVLRTTFFNLTRLTQTFDVGNHRTFYCPKFQDLWIQRSWLVKNPVRPKSRCGALVN